MTEEIKKDFLFLNQTTAMQPLVKEIVAFMKIHLPSPSCEEKIANCRQILIELLTNAIKHSEAEETTVTVTFSNNQIKISKKDKGRKFYLTHYAGMPPLNLPFEKKYIGGRIKIYEDDISHLYSIIQNENKIIFELLEYPVEEITAESDLLEHYGLLILTKLSDEFYYIYDVSSDSNIFTTVIYLD